MSKAGAFLLAPAAAEDVREIWEFIADDNVDAADRVIDDLRSAMRMIARRPGIGHPRTDLAPAALRFWPVHSYLVVYKPEARPVEIVRVLSASRDIPRLLGR